MIRKYAANFGVIELQPDQCVFNRRNVAILIIYGLYFISATYSLLYESSTFKSYAESFYAWLSLTADTMGYFIMIIRSQNLYQVLQKLEKLIENRKQMFTFGYFMFNLTNF